MINYLKKNKNIFCFTIILALLFIVYKQHDVIKNKNEEIYLLENITEEFNVGLQNFINNNNNNNNNSNNNSNICPECPSCNEQEWNGPPCPDCNECPVFYNDKLIYKDLITRYKIDFPDYDMLDNDKKNILDEIFSSDNPLPEPNIDREYFPYNTLGTKIDMNNVMPSMA